MPPLPNERKGTLEGTHAMRLASHLAECPILLHPLHEAPRPVLCHAWLSIPIITFASSWLAMIPYGELANLRGCSGRWSWQPLRVIASDAAEDVHRSWRSFARRDGQGRILRQCRFRLGARRFGH